jgi:repressor LexA
VTDLPGPRAHILDVIRQSVRDRGYPPTVREIADAVALSKPGVIYQLRVLQRMGLIERDPGSSRAIRLAESPRPSKCPHCKGTGLAVTP